MNWNSIVAMGCVVWLITLVVSHARANPDKAESAAPTTSTTSALDHGTPLPEDSGNWGVYSNLIEGKEAYFRVDLARLESAPDATSPVLCLIGVWYRQRLPNALPDKTAFPALNSIEERLTTRLWRDFRAKLVGILTLDGRREFYFYSPESPKLAERVKELLQGDPEHPFRVDLHNDPDWKTYKDLLYPDEEALQQIGNQRVVSSLIKAGDEGAVPRPVDHLAYFKTDSDRANFIKRAVALGFDESSVNLLASESPFQFGVEMKKTHTVDYATANGVALAAYRLAIECGGKYDGWGAPVTKR